MPVKPITGVGAAIEARWAVVGWRLMTGLQILRRQVVLDLSVAMGA